MAPKPTTGDKRSSPSGAAGHDKSTWPAGVLKVALKRPATTQNDAEEPSTKKPKTMRGVPIATLDKLADNLPDPKTLPLTVRALRNAIAMADIQVAHSFEYKGWKSLDAEQLLEAYTRRYKAIVGNRIMRQWAATFPHGVIPGTGCRHVCALFWYSEDTTKPSIAWSVESGVRSATINGGYSGVWLYAYQHLDNVPEGVTVKDAAALLPMEKFMLYREQGFILPHISDFVRLLAARHGGGDITDIVDCDALHINEEPIDGFDFAYLGHWFGTLGLNPCSFENRDMKKRQIKLSLEYCQHPRDMWKFNMPMSVPASSPFLAAVIQQVQAYFDSGTPSDDYDVLMNIIRTNIIEFGLENAFAPPEAFSVIPYWAGQKVLQPGSDAPPKVIYVRSPIFFSRSGHVSV